MSSPRVTQEDNSMNADKPYKQPGWIAKFRCAFLGVAQGIPGQSSFVVFIPAALLVIVLGLLLGVSAVEWCLLFVAIGGVIATEYLNTSVELLASSVTDEYHEIVEKCLNVSSAAVLVSAATAVLVGLVIFGGKLISLVPSTE